VDPIMMSLAPPVANPAAANASKGRGGAESKETFAKYMDKKLDDAGRKKDLLGVGQRLRNQKAAGDKEKAAKAASGEDGDAVTASSIASLLQQFLQELREMAKNGGVKPGEWSFPVPDPGVVQQLATDAGMDASEITALMGQIEQKDGVMGLQDFFAALARHFEGAGKEQPITVPETDLPLFETLLSKAGVPVEKVVDMADKAVTGDGRLDLVVLLKGIEGMKPAADRGREKAEATAQPVVLSPWEAEQLQNILAKIGVSEQLQKSLIPAQGEGELPFSLERLQEVLGQAVAEVRESAPRLDAVAFLRDLQQILSQSSFTDKSVGWSPAVQETVNSIYEELVKSVDLATVKAQPLATPKGAEIRKDKGLVEEADELLAATGQEETGEEVAEVVTEGREARGGNNQREGGPFPEHVVPAGKSESLAAAIATNFHHAAMNAGEAEQGGALPQGPRMPPGLAQQTFEHISQNVLTGLKNNEHHMVLRLFPRELGEVKVEMMVRDQHVSINFAMENSRVKETLESNMQQFQDNLTKQGFVLDGCQVSVGQQGDQDAAWQAFEQARQQHGQGRGKKETLAELPNDTLYIKPLRDAGREGGISLLI